MRNKIKFNVKKCLTVATTTMILYSNVVICNAETPKNTSVIETQVEQITVLDTLKSITTDRIMLTPTTDEDIADLAKYFKDKDVQDTFGIGTQLSGSEALKTLKLILTKSLESNLMRIFTIKSLENKAIGQVWIRLKDGTEDCFCIDSWIGKSFWGQSIVPEAVCALINHLNKPNINISFTLSSENKKSERAVLKVGEKLGAFIKNSKGEYIPRISKTSKFYLKEKNIYRNIYTQLEGNDSQINFKAYKNDKLLFDQNISKDMLSNELSKGGSSIEYIFSNIKNN